MKRKYIKSGVVNYNQLTVSVEYEDKKYWESRCLEQIVRVYLSPYQGHGNEKPS